MNEKLNLTDLAGLLENRAGLSKSEAETFLRELFALISETLSETEQVKIKNFGTFKLTRVQARESIDVNTGEKFEIPSHLKLNFLPATELKELVNKPFSYFETTLLNQGVSFADLNLSDDDEEEMDEETEETLDTELVNNVPEITAEPLVIEQTEEIEAKEMFSVKEEMPVTATQVSHVDNEAGVVLRKPMYKRKKPDIFVPILGAVAVAAAVLFFFVQVGRKPEKEKNDPHQALTAKAQPVNTVLTDTKMNVTKPVEEVEKVVLPAGKTLRLLALDKFGSREFWVYIYYKNKDRIKNPNIVPIGTELVMPGADEFDIDRFNAEFILRAKALGDKELMKFK